MFAKQAKSQQAPRQHDDDGLLRSIGPLEQLASEKAVGTRPARAAIFVIHGRGQQILFETLDQTASGLIHAATFLFQKTAQITPYMSV